MPVGSILPVVEGDSRHWQSSDLSVQVIPKVFSWVHVGKTCWPLQNNDVSILQKNVCQSGVIVLVDDASLLLPGKWHYNWL